MIIIEDKMKTYYDSAQKSAFTAAVIHTMARDHSVIEKDMAKYMEQNIHNFINWLFNKGKCTYTLKLNKNEIVLENYNRDLRI